MPAPAIVAVGDEITFESDYNASYTPVALDHLEVPIPDEARDGDKILIVASLVFDIDTDLHLNGWFSAIHWPYNDGGHSWAGLSVAAVSIANGAIDHVSGDWESLYTGYVTTYGYAYDSDTPHPGWFVGGTHIGPSDPSTFLIPAWANETPTDGSQTCQARFYAIAARAVVFRNVTGVGGGGIVYDDTTYDPPDVIAAADFPSRSRLLDTTAAPGYSPFASARGVHLSYAQIAESSHVAMAVPNEFGEAFGGGGLHTFGAVKYSNRYLFAARLVPTTDVPIYQPRWTSDDAISLGMNGGLALPTNWVDGAGWRIGSTRSTNQPGW